MEKNIPGGPPISGGEKLWSIIEGLKQKNSELTEVNEALRIRNEKIIVINNDLADLLTGTEVPIIILDLDRRIKCFSQEAQTLMKLVPGDVGRPMSEIPYNVAIKNLDQQIQEVISTLTIKEADVQDQRQKYCRLQVRPLMKLDNALAGVIIVLIDTPGVGDLLKQIAILKDRVVEADLAEDLFLGTLSHELRTPLTSLLLEAQLLLHVDSYDPRVIRAGLAIERAAKNQAQVIDDLFDISKIVTGKLKPIARISTPTLNLVTWQISRCLFPISTMTGMTPRPRTPMNLCSVSSGLSWQILS